MDGLDHNRIISMDGISYIAEIYSRLNYGINNLKREEGSSTNGSDCDQHHINDRGEFY